jgi:putative endonuclease
MGEIDIIARRGNLLIFVEVKTRAPGSMQHPLETVDSVKVSRTVRAAQVYLQRFQQPLPFCRFDTLGIIQENRFSEGHLWHVMGIFDTSSNQYMEGCRREMMRKRWRFGRRGKGDPATGG